MVSWSELQGWRLPSECGSPARKTPYRNENEHWMLADNSRGARRPGCDRSEPFGDPQHRVEGRVGAQPDDRLTSRQRLRNSVRTPCRWRPSMQGKLWLATLMRCAKQRVPLRGFQNSFLTETGNSRRYPAHTARYVCAQMRMLRFARVREAKQVMQSTCGGLRAHE